MATQSETLLHMSPIAVPAVVSFIATQKTNATKKTMSVYSTRPCPSVSFNSFLRRAWAGTEVLKNPSMARVGMPHFFVKRVKRVEQSADYNAVILVAGSLLSEIDQRVS